MGWMRRLLIALGGLVVLAGLGLAALLLLVDPNDYKATLEAAVKERYNRTLSIDGDIRLSVVPGLGLDISKVSLSEPNSTQVFAAVDNARVSVAWWPLLSRHLVIDHLGVTGIKANVVRDAEGRFNFHDLMQPSADQAGADAPAEPRDGDAHSIQLNIAGVSLDGGEIAVRDEAHDMTVRLGALAMSARGIALDEPFDFSLSGRMLGQSPRADATIQMQGRLTVAPYAERYAVKGLDLRVAGVLPSVKATTFTVRGDAAYDAARGALQVSGLNLVFQGDMALTTPMTGVDAQLNVPTLNADMRQGTIELEKSVVKASGRMGASPFSLSLNAPVLRITDQAAGGGPLQAAFTLDGEQTIDAKLSLSGLGGNAKHFEVDEMKLTATHKRGGRTAGIAAASPIVASLADRTFEWPELRAQVDLVDPALPGGKMEIPVTGKLRTDLAADTASAELRATVEGGALEASADVTGFERPAVVFKLGAQTLDLDKLWPAAPPAAAAPANAGGKSAAPAAETPVDLAFLQDLDIKGNVRVADLKARGIEMQQVVANLAVAKGRASLSGLSARLYEGTLAGSAFAEADGNRLGVDAKLANVSVEPLLRAVAGYDALSGKGNVNVAVTAAGKTRSALLKSLEGSGSVALRDGRIQGFNVAQSLREFKAMIPIGQVQKQEADQARATDFSELRSQIRIQQGVGTLHDLMVAAPLLRISEGAPANVNFVDETLDLVANVKVVNTSTGQDGKALEELRDITVPIHLTGPFRSPEYAIQWSQVGSQALKRTLQNELGRQVDRLLDRGRDSGQGESSGDNPTGKILGEALKGLFKQ